MKIGTSSSYNTSKYGDERGIIKLAEAGFDCLDYGLFEYPIRGELFTSSEESRKAYFSRLKDVADKADIYVQQVHSPMPSYTANPDEDAYLFDIQVKSIKIASYLGSKYIVIHPAIPHQYRYSFYRAETKEINMDFYSRLLPYLKDYNIKLGIENMFNWDPEKKCICPTVCSTAEEILDYIETLGDDHFVACLDTGHANLTGDTPDNMARILGKKLEVLHVHDNDGINDQHIAPFMGKIDWNKFMQTLKDINYKGDFTFEADSFYSMFSAVTDSSAKFLCEIGKHLTE